MLNIFSYQVLTKLQSLIQRSYSISQLSATQDTFTVRFLNNASFTKNCTLTNWLLLHVRKSCMLQDTAKRSMIQANMMT